MKLRLADESHNDALCELSARVTMPGSMEVAYLRDPDYFAALRTQGDFHQTIVGVENDRVVGSGSRSVRLLHVNGEESPVGYLGALRIHPDHRSRGFLARGYRYLRTLHQDGRCPAYLSTIIEENRYARSQLTGNRAGLPRYEDLGLYLTHALLLNTRSRISPPPPGITLRRAGAGDETRVAEFLNREGKKRQFFPHHDPSEYGTPLYRDFRTEDWYLAERGTVLAGVLGLWNQEGFKRNSVVAYSPLMSTGRPLLNAGLRALGYRPLPAPGGRLPLLHLFSPCIANDDTRILRALVSRIRSDLSRSPATALILGFHERDPLRLALKSFPSIIYKSRLFLVFWEDGSRFYEELDPGRIPHLEAALL